MQLHYAAGPQQFELLECSGTPSVTSCATPYSSILDNTGTLRFHIKHPGYPGNPDPCDYHVHGAYHKMLSLVDSGLSSVSNAKKSYVDVPKYRDGCSPCDPLQDSDCNTMGGLSAFEPEDISKSLDRLLAFPNGIGLNDSQKAAARNTAIDRAGKHETRQVPETDSARGRIHEPECRSILESWNNEADQDASIARG